MAWAIDASSPSRVTDTGTYNDAVTSAFSPPANSVLIACCHGDGGTSTTVVTTTVTSSPSQTWNLVQQRNAGDSGGQGGVAAVHYAVIGSAPGSTTVTLALTGTGRLAPSLKVYVVTGLAASGTLVQSTEGSSTTNNLTTSALPAATAIGNLVLAAGTDFQALGNPASSDLTVDAFTATGNISGVSGYKSATGAADTANLDAAGTSAAAWNWVLAEFKFAPAAVAQPIAVISQYDGYF